MQQCKDTTNKDFYFDSRISLSLTITRKTSHFLLTSLRGIANLLKYLLNENNIYILTVIFQSYPIKRYFRNYMQMSEGNFLVSTREVNNSEKLLALNNFIKEDASLSESNFHTDDNTDDVTTEL